MKFTQKRFSNRVSFDLGDEGFRYSIQDSSGRRGCSVDYLDFDPSFEDFEERNAWFRNVGLLWILIGIVSVVEQFVRNGTASGSVWLTLGVVLLLVFRFATTRYAVHSVRGGSIVIIKDNEHPAILEELSRRRRRRLADVYGAVDPSRDPAAEIQKFEWLSEEGALSREEAQEKIVSIQRRADCPATLQVPQSLN